MTSSTRDILMEYNNQLANFTTTKIPQMYSNKNYPSTTNSIIILYVYCPLRSKRQQTLSLSLLTYHHQVCVCGGLSHCFA